MRSSMHKEYAASDGETDQTVEISENEGGVKTVKRIKLGADKEMMHAFLSSVEFNPSRLRPRKDIPTTALETWASKEHPLKSQVPKEVDFKMVDLGDQDGPEIIGRRVEVYWPDSRRWFRGRVKAFDHQKMVHKIDYDDGDKEHLDLKNEVFRMEVYPGENVNIRPECNIKYKPKLPIAVNERQKGGKAEKGAGVENCDSCSGFLEKELGKTLSCRQSLSQVEMAADVESCSAPADEQLVQSISSNPVSDIIKPKDKSDLAFKSFEDEYLNILRLKSEAEDPNLLGEHFEHQMAKKFVRSSSEKSQLQVELRNGDKNLVDKWTCTNYYVRRKSPNSNISKVWRSKV